MESRSLGDLSTLGGGENVLRLCSGEGRRRGLSEKFRYEAGFDGRDLCGGDGCIGAGGLIM